MMKIRNAVGFKLLVITTTFIVLVKAHIYETFYAEKMTEQKRDYRCEKSYAAFSVSTLSRCASVCHRDLACFGFNYNGASGVCELVNGITIHFIVPASGYSVYQKDHAQAEIYFIIIYMNPLSKPEAEQACAPIGHLARFETLDKFNVIAFYLESLLPDASLMNVWADGYYNTTDGVWEFADDSPLPTGSPIYKVDDPIPTCIRLCYDVNVLKYYLCDVNCSVRYSYMCELY